MVWEAMGTPILPMIKGLYGSTNTVAAYYAARTGLRMGDASAMEVVIHHARDPHSPVRMSAIWEIGNNPRVFRGSEDLQELLSDDSESVRIAAYDALIRREDHEAIHRIDLGYFCLDVVKSQNSKRLIYATQSGVAKIVLMGEDMPMLQEIYFTSVNGDVIVNADATSNRISAARKVPRSGKFTPACPRRATWPRWSACWAPSPIRTSPAPRRPWACPTARSSACSTGCAKNTILRPVSSCNRRRECRQSARPAQARRGRTCRKNPMWVLPRFCRQSERSARQGCRAAALRKTRK